MGFWDIFHNDRPGPGISKEEALNQPPLRRFFRILFTKLKDIILTNMLFVICCIPVVTLFFSIAGMTKIHRNFVWEKNASLIGDFFGTVKSNFKQLLAVTLINIPVFSFIILGIRTYILWLNEGLSLGIYFGLFIFVSLFFTVVNFYVFQIIITFDLKLRQVYKNAFILSVAGLVRNAMALLVCGIILYPCFILLINSYTMSLYLLAVAVTVFVPSLLCFVIEFFTFPVIIKYIIEPYEKQNPKNDDETPVFSDELKH